MMTERLLALNQRIEAACSKAGREPKSVRVVAVSKGHRDSQIIDAYDIGLRNFGENYALEMAQKIDSLREKCPEVSWHYIGHIQSNKLAAISAASWVHTLSELKHAEALSKLVVPGRVINALLQVNLGRESQRSGVFVEDVLERYAQMMKLPGLCLSGLMTIAPVAEGSGPSYWFKQIQEIRVKLEQKIGQAVPELSMGMSGDFEEAITFGATFIRVGTLLFGERELRAKH